jgi:DNA-binding IclR family transcriptional regulator
MTRVGQSSGVKSVELGLDVLEAVAQSEDGIGVSALAARLGFTKAAVFRHLQTLARRGYVVQDGATARYRLGIRASLIGRLASEGTHLMSVARAPLRRLRDETGQTVTLAAVTSRSIVVVDCLLGTAAMEIGIKAGSELPIHATAHGRIALAFSRVLDVAWLKSAELKPWTTRTLCDWKALEEQVLLTRKRGWATSPEQMLLGINALSAPVFDRTGDCLAAVALVGSIQFIPPAPGKRELSALLRTTQQISRSLWDGSQQGTRNLQSARSMARL